MSDFQMPIMTNEFMADGDIARIDNEGQETFMMNKRTFKVVSIQLSLENECPVLSMTAERWARYMADPRWLTPWEWIKDEEQLLIDKVIERMNEDIERTFICGNPDKEPKGIMHDQFVEGKKLTGKMFMEKVAEFDKAMKGASKNARFLLKAFDNFPPEAFNGPE